MNFSLLCLFLFICPAASVELGDKIVWRKQENGAVCCTKGANFSSKVLQQIIGSYKDNRIVPRVRTEEQKHDKNVTYQVQNEESLKVMLLNAKDGILALIKCNTTCTMRTLCLYCYLFRSCDLCIIIIHKHCGRDIVSCIKPCRYISIYYRLSDAIIQQGKWESSTAEVRIQGGLCQKFCSQVRIQRGLCQKFCAQVRIQRGLCQKFCDMNSLFFYVFTTSHLPNLVNNKSYNLVYIKFLKLLEKNNVNRPFCFIGFIPITLRTAKRLWSYGCSECYRDRCHFKLKLRKSFISSSYDANHLVEQRLSATGELDENESASPVISNSYEAYYHVQRRILSATGELGESTSPGTAGDLGSLVESKMYERSPYDDQKVFNYTVYFKLMDYLKRKRSKDPVWAMFSVMLVIFVLVWASWCCGLRKIDTKKFIDVTIDESFHYISVRDILRSKRKYLSKKILQFKRRHRHRKHKYKRLKELEAMERDIVSDNSEDERLIYAKDF